VTQFFKLREARLILIAALAACLLLLEATTGEASSDEGTMAQAKAYQRPVIEAPVCEEPPIIDGVLDDPCWQQAYHTDEFWNTDDHCAPSERTEAWLCVDASALYVAVYAYDSQPGGIMCQETKHGGNISNDDYISIGIDADHTGDRMYTFQATANGTQKESIPGGSDTKIEWRGDWSAAAQVVGDGWRLEVKIPFGILRYPAGQSVWGVDIWRHHPRTNDCFNWPPQPERWDNREIAELRGLKLPRIAARPIIMPNVQTEWHDGHFRTNLSLDAKYTHSSGLTGVMSVTPDFRNIEDEVESIDFSYTERWYQDRRPFFVEGGGYFPRRDVFYTRRIPDFDVGVKMFGTIDRTSIGLLDAWTLGGRNDVALNVRQSIADYSRVDLGYVRTDRGDLDNQTYYAGARYRKILGRGSFSLSGRLFESHTEGGDTGTSWSVYARRSRDRGKPSFWANYRRVDPTFDPQDGYVPDTDLEGLSAGIRLWDSFENRRTEACSYSLSLGSFDHTDGSRYHDDISLGHSVDYRDGTWWNVDWSHSDRPPNVDHTWGASFGWNAKKLHQGGDAGIRWGRRGGADYLFYNVGQGIRISDKLRFYIGHEYRESDYPDDGEDERIQRTTLTFNYDLTPEKTLSGRVLTGSAGTNAYMSYRQAVRKGTDLFVILGDPNADQTQSRLALKAKWTYQ